MPRPSSPECRSSTSSTGSGPRTRIATIQPPTDADIAALVDDDWIAAHRLRALDPDRPVLRGTAQNPDVFFQAREALNPFVDSVPSIVEGALRAARRADRPPLRARRVLGGARRRTCRRTDGVGGRCSLRSRRGPHRGGREGGVAPGPSLPTIPECGDRRRPVRRRARRRSASIARRNPARPASRYDSMCLQRSPMPRVEESVRCRASWAGATDSPPRSSPRRWHGPCSRRSTRTSRVTASRSASSTT